MTTPDPQQRHDAEAEEFDEAERLLQRFVDHPEDFEEVPESGVSPARLGVVISVRFDADQAQRLREVAKQLDVPYTALVRRFVEERLVEFERPNEAAPSRRRVLMDVEIDAAGHLLLREAG